MTPYSIEFVPSAARDYKRLESFLLPRVLRALETLAAQPLGGKPLQGPYHGLRSHRVGDYRIVYRADSNARLLIVYRIGHRRDVYHP